MGILSVKLAAYGVLSLAHSILFFFIPMFLTIFERFPIGDEQLFIDKY